MLKFLRCLTDAAPTRSDSSASLGGVGCPADVSFLAFRQNVGGEPRRFAWKEDLSCLKHDALCLHPGELFDPRRVCEARRIGSGVGDGWPAAICLRDRTACLPSPLGVVTVVRYSAEQDCLDIAIGA